MHDGGYGREWATVMASVVMAGIAGVAAHRAMPGLLSWPTRLSFCWQYTWGLSRRSCWRPQTDRLLSHVRRPMFLSVRCFCDRGCDAQQDPGSSWIPSANRLLTRVVRKASSSLMKVPPEPPKWRYTWAATYASTLCRTKGLGARQGVL